MIIRPGIMEWYGSPLTTYEVIYEKGNMENISKTILIDISRAFDVINNFFIGAQYSPEEIEIYISLFKEYHVISS